MSGLFVDNITKEQEEHSRKWIEELRSGEWKQGYGRLRKLNREGELTHCCLGVAKELIGGVTWQSSLVCYVPVRDDKEENSTVLENPDKDYYGLSSINSRLLLNRKHTAQLTEINDSGKSFNYIADIIEKELNLVTSGWVNED